MLTRAEVIERLLKLERELGSLRRALGDGVAEADDAGATETFLAKCGGWEDSRTADEIVADIYASRTSSVEAPQFRDEGAG